jgi:inositol polyphosphate-4-phosphatase
MHIFSWQLTSLVVGLMAKLWCQKPDPTFLMVLTTLGPLVSFEGLLSYYGDEIDMWGDMAVAVEDLLTVTFTLTRCTSSNPKYVHVYRTVLLVAYLLTLFRNSDESVD